MKSPGDPIKTDEPNDPQETRDAIVTLMVKEVETVWNEWVRGVKDGWAILMGVGSWFGILALAGHAPTSESVWIHIGNFPTWAHHVSGKIGISHPSAAVIIITSASILLAIRGRHVGAVPVFTIHGRGGRRIFGLPSLMLFILFSGLIIGRPPYAEWKLWLALSPANILFCLYPRVAVSVWSALLIVILIAAATSTIW